VPNVSPGVSEGDLLQLMDTEERALASWSCRTAYVSLLHCPCRQAGLASRTA